MPYYDTADEWLRQSQLLVAARPTTTKVTTRYSIKPVAPLRKAKEGASTEPKPPRGSLVLKTFDPKTGTTLKYKTTKAAEVSRLIMNLGKLGRPMAGLPEQKEDATMLDVPESGTGTPAGDKPEPAATPQGQQGGGSGGKNKKKKGKR